MEHPWLHLLSGPLFAAAWLIYGRLLGRMAYILQQEPVRKKRKKKKKKIETETTEEVEPEEVMAKQEISNGDDAYEFIKGPREDARGPGGARPV